MELVLNPVREGNGARTGLILRVIMGGFVGDDEDGSKINVILLLAEWKYAVSGLSR